MIHGIPLFELQEIIIRHNGVLIGKDGMCLVVSRFPGYDYSHKNEKKESGRPDAKPLGCDVCSDLPCSMTYSDSDSRKILSMGLDVVLF